MTRLGEVKVSLGIDFSKLEERFAEALRRGIVGVRYTREQTTKAEEVFAALEAAGLTVGEVSNAGATYETSLHIAGESHDMRLSTSGGHKALLRFVRLIGIGLAVEQATALPEEDHTGSHGRDV